VDAILRGRRVLVVDDTATIRAIVGDVLAPSGVQILEADSAENALRVAAEQAIDAFLLDIRLPEMNGIELCRALRAIERYRNAPIMFVTAVDQREILQWALEAGCDDFIQKPVYPMVLRKRLANLLEKADYLKELEALRAATARGSAPSGT
jgi:CheY-like chemotaxis protein